MLLLLPLPARLKKKKIINREVPRELNNKAAKLKLSMEKKRKARKLQSQAFLGPRPRTKATNHKQAKDLPPKRKGKGHIAPPLHSSNNDGHLSHNQKLCPKEELQPSSLYQKR
ncbi:hypothetical protein M9H77_26189 [Catharanthus roseus]|uniref:Uncharacterized protein n=1 Tax=Catharanthus roseus TaxID=4058 RepID=A0ACC0A9Y9_CATRO|nr:hypothetical protein M9H77_26189 [Catharanthus roseus]